MFWNANDPRLHQPSGAYAPCAVSAALAQHFGSGACTDRITRSVRLPPRQARRRDRAFAVPRLPDLSSSSDYETVPTVMAMRATASCLWNGRVYELDLCGRAFRPIVGLWRCDCQYIEDGQCGARRLKRSSLDRLDHRRLGQRAPARALCVGMLSSWSVYCYSTGACFYSFLHSCIETRCF